MKMQALPNPSFPGAHRRANALTVPSFKLMLRQLIFFAMLLALSALQAPAQQKTGSLKIEPYVLETYDKQQKVDAELGRLIVPENRRARRSNPIELVFVRLKSTAKLPGPPILFLSGGPGASGINEARGAAYTSLMALREIGDVVVLDQRGTGMSQPSLICARTWDLPLNRPGDPVEWMVLAKERIRACVQEMKDKGIDLAGYNTNESADDIEALRQALGERKVSLWGVSYGTHLALATLRRHGKSIERVVLTGVNGPDHLMMKLPSTIEEQLFKLNQLFAADAKVSKLIPDLSALLKNLLDKLEKNPITVEITDPRTKQTVSVALSKWDLQFHTASPVTQTWSIMGLPAFFHALSKGDFTPLAQRALEFRRGQVGSMMAWMMLGASAASAERHARVRREAEKTLLGNAINFPFPEINEALVEADLGAKFRAPVKSRIPALFISGTLDGRTPVSNAEEVKKNFPNGEHLIVEGASHGYDLFYFTPKVRDAMLEFLKGNTIPTGRITLSAFPFNPVNPVKSN